MQASRDDEVIELPPSFALKEKIGKDVKMNEVFTTEAIQSSQEIIKETKGDFLKWADTDLKAMNLAYQTAAKDAKEETSCITAIKKGAFSLKSQAGTFGFDLGSIIAKSLYDFCENNYRPQGDHHLLIVRKHLDALQTIFHHDLIGDGGKVGLALLQALGELIHKYTPKQ